MRIVCSMISRNASDKPVRKLGREGGRVGGTQGDLDRPDRMVFCRREVLDNAANERRYRTADNKVGYVSMYVD